MSPKSLIFYFLVLLADILLIVSGKDEYRYATKPLLVLLLAVYVLYTDIKIPRPQHLFLLLALFFSSLGDDLLLYDRYFVAGLGSFLAAHIMYIVFFLKIRYSNPPVPLCKYPLILLTAAAAILFILFLAPYLGSLTIPVIIYTAVISFMLLSALHAFHFRRQRAGLYCVTGALLFIISDALIATGKFYHSFPGSGILVMLTYGVAQYALVYGGTEYFRERITN